MKIGVLSFNLNPNYGWALQAFALQTFLKKNGFDAIYIYRRWDNSPTDVFSRLKRFIYFKLFVSPFYSFFESHIKHTRPYISTPDIEKVVDEYGLNTVIVGSDQVWRLRYTYSLKFNFFLDFVKNASVKKIAYAPSFGHDKWEGNDVDTGNVKQLLKMFDAISVREKSGVKICKDSFDADAKFVADPTLLLDAEDYNFILSKENIFNKPTISTYILDSCDSKDDLIQSIAKKENASVRHLFPLRKKYTRFKTSVEDWLRSIRDAKFVVVDSFHGMVFSILFKKPFVAIVNKDRGAERFETLASVLGLESRLIYDLENVDASLFDEQINYSIVDEKLAAFRKSSADFLLEALK